MKNLLLVVIVLLISSCGGFNTNKEDNMMGFKLKGLEVKRMNLLYHGRGNKFEYIFLDMSLGDNYKREYCLLIKNKFSKICKLKKNEYFIQEQDVNIPIENKEDFVIGFNESKIFFIKGKSFSGESDLKFILNNIVDFVIPLRPKHDEGCSIPTDNSSTEY